MTPLTSHHSDATINSDQLNLADEIYRVLKPGGHLSH